jgi:hypothetical protein
LYKEELFELEENNGGIVLPTGDENNGFFLKWHKYLKEQGVDFLKVDVQASALEFYKNTPHTLQKTVDLHSALERSVKKYFGGAMINCMGLSNIQAYSREFSSVLRNSDDFFPNRDNGFEGHIIQNAYNAVFNDNLYYCDFDMWWTRHFSAKQSSALRAISGGPVYVSDKVDETEAEYIIPMLDENDNIIRCPHAARPTADCLLNNPQGDVIKVYNKVGENIVIGVFNLSKERRKAFVNLLDVYADGEYIGYSYFGRKYMREIEVELEGDDVEIVNLYKVNDGKIKIGNTKKYISIATKCEKEIDVNSL